MFGQDRRRPLQGAAQDLREIDQGEARRDGPRFQPGHIQEIGDEAVETLRLLLDRRHELLLRRLVIGLGIGPEAGDGAQDRGQRRLQIMGDRGQQGRAQPVGLGQQPGTVEIMGERRALDGERRLIAERVEQAALIGREQGAFPLARQAHHPDGPAAGADGQEQALGARQGVGAAPRLSIVLPAPFGRRQIRLVEGVLRRIAAAHGDRALLRQQDHHRHLQHEGDLIGGGPEQIVQGHRAAELAAEEIEILRRLRPLARGQRLAAHARGQIARDQGDDGEEEQRDDVLGIGDGEGIERRQEEEVVGQAC